MTATVERPVDGAGDCRPRRMTMLRALADAAAVCHMCHRGVIIGAAALLAACGGSDGSIDAPAPAAPAAPVARVEILSAGAWLPGDGQTQQLGAQAYDAAGNPVSAAISWTSSRAEHVAVDATGRLTAMVAAGSAQIAAHAGGVASVPILAFVATPAPGVVVVDDANIVGQPVDTDPAAAPSLANTYAVTLTGTAAPAVGTLMLGRGDKPLAGRVTAVAAAGAQTQVTLQLVPLAELFALVEINEVFDLSRAEVMIPPDVAAAFDVARDGDTWTFTSRPTGTPLARPQAVTGTHARDLLPFRSCEVTPFGEFESASDLPIGLEPPTFSITLRPSYEASLDSNNRLTRLVVQADPEVKTGATLQATAPLALGIECSLQLFALHLPISGPMAFFIGGLVPIGVGFELEATTTLGSVKIGSQAEARALVSVGLECVPPEECAFVRSLTAPVARVTPTFEPPNLAQDLRFASELSVFGYLEAEIGNPFLRSLRFKGFKAHIGGKLEGEFAPPVTQVLDEQFAARYTAAIEGSAKVGTGISELIALLGLGSLRNIGLEFEQPLAVSPRAVVVRTDRAAFAAGDVVHVRVILDPTSVNFLPGIYNVDSVQLRRRVGSSTEVLASQSATSGQDRFEFYVEATYDGDVGEWFAFVTTRLLPFELASLELDRAGPAGVLVLLTRAFMNHDRSCEAFAEMDVQGGGGIDDETTSKAEPAICRATASAATAQASASVNFSGPVLAEGALPPEVTELSGSGSASLTASANVPSDTATIKWEASGSGSGHASGTWELLIQGQVVTMTISGSVSNAGFRAEWDMSADGRGTAGQYRLSGDEDAGATGPLSHTVRLESGQRIRITAGTHTHSGRADVRVDGNPDTSDRPQGQSADMQSSFAFTVRFDP